VIPVVSSWTIRLSTAAAADFRSILHWTTRQFGAQQARVYEQTLISALQTLRTGPSACGARARPDIETGLYTLHVARGGRKGRHIILFRMGRMADTDVIDVIRLLHDAMDITRFLAPAPREFDET